MTGAFRGSLRDLESAQVAGYTIDAELGRGGHSTVYRARDEAGELVAIKRWLTPELGHRALHRIERETEALRTLDHPQIARFVELTQDSQGRPCLVMELVEGQSLAQRLEAGPLEPKEALEIGLSLSRTLEVLASHDLVHRDLKPANVVLRDHLPVLIDFSIVKPCAVGADPHALTETGAAVGSNPYMAPEQCAGELGDGIDPRTDIYGLGALLFHAITGHSPWASESAWERLQRNPWHDPYPTRPTIRRAVRARQQAIPAALGKIVGSCLEGRIDRRPLGARALTQRLEAVQRPLRWRRPAALLGVALCIGAVYGFYDHVLEPRPTQEWREASVISMSTTTPSPSHPAASPASPDSGTRTKPVSSGQPPPTPGWVDRAHLALQRLSSCAHAWDLVAAGAHFDPRVVRVHRDLRPQYRAESVTRPERHRLVAQVADALASPGSPLASMVWVPVEELPTGLRALLPNGGVRATLGRRKARVAMELYFDIEGRIRGVASVDRDPTSR